MYIGPVKTYKRPKLLISPHFETIYPALFRRVPEVDYTRERIDTPDGDFLDLDWIKQDSKQVIIISHGLEGDSHRPYVRGMARTFAEEGFDVLAWNFRGCSGEMNRTLRFYHSGAIDDLKLIIDHAWKSGYEHINLVGFSLGGNLTLKFLGEYGTDAGIHRAIAISVPLELHTSCVKISEPQNFLYSRRFLRNLSEKVRKKAIMMPDKLDTEPLSRINTLMEFDDLYTAPIHGFADARDYYAKCSSLYALDQITTPTLIINAANDPFLSSDCYPVEELKKHPAITLEVPDYGGHVGFTSFNPDKRYWSERRAFRFIQSND